MTAVAQERDDAAITAVGLRAPRRGGLVCSFCGGPKMPKRTRCDGCYGLHKLGETFLSQTASYADDARCRHLVRHFRDGMSLEDIGDLLGITRERVRQIEHVAMRHFIARAKLADITADDMRAVFQRANRDEAVPATLDDLGNRAYQQGRVARIFTPDSLVESDYTRELNERLDEAHAVGLLACHAANLAEYAR